MAELDRRKLLQVGIAFTVPTGVVSLLGGCKQPTETAKGNDSSLANDSAKAKGSSKVMKTDESDNQPEKNSESKTMQIEYLEIVTTDVDALCKQYSAIHGITFSDPVANLGGARTAEVEGGGKLAIRGPLRETETPVIRPYVLVDDIEASVAAAKAAGAEIAIESMEIPDHGTIAVVIQGGIQCGLWKKA